MAIAISIGVFGVVACCLVFWTALVISKVDCADELSEAGYSDWCGSETVNTKGESC